MATAAKRARMPSRKAVRPSSLSATPSSLPVTTPDLLCQMTTGTLPPTPSPSGSSNQDFPMEASPSPSPTLSPEEGEGESRLPALDLDATLEGLELEAAPPHPRKYNLRRSSVMTRIHSELRRQSPRTPKPKAKPAPLSKYRRRAANCRERSRMEEMNVAFENLRQCLPPMQEDSQGNKVTKITTLRTASDYIRALMEILGLGAMDGSSSSPSTGSADSPPHAFSSPSSSSSAPCSSDEGSLSPSLCSRGSLGVSQAVEPFPARSVPSGTQSEPASAPGGGQHPPPAPSLPLVCTGTDPPDHLHVSLQGSVSAVQGLQDFGMGHSVHMGDHVDLGDSELDIPEGQLLVTDDPDLSCLPLPDMDLDSVDDLLS